MVQVGVSSSEYSPSRKEFFYIGGIKKHLIRCQISCSKTRYIGFQRKLPFKLAKDLYK